MTQKVCPVKKKFKLTLFPSKHGTHAVKQKPAMKRNKVCYQNLNKPSTVEAFTSEVGAAIEVSSDDKDTTIEWSVASTPPLT